MRKQRLYMQRMQKEFLIDKYYGISFYLLTSQADNASLNSVRRLKIKQYFLFIPEKERKIKGNLLKFKSVFSCGICKSFNFTRIFISPAIKNNFFHPFFSRFFCN